MTGNAIANRRYVVQGQRDDDKRVWAIHATDSRTDAEAVLATGVTRNGRHWTGARVWDRRTAILPPQGWGSLA